MRACFYAVVVSVFAFAQSLHMRAQAQDTQQPRAATGKGNIADVAEQLVVQVHGWFENLGAHGASPGIRA